MATRVTIVGGGAIGSAIATFISADPSFKSEVTVIERDPSYQRASSALSASSIRQQFSTALNIQMSQFGFDYIRSLDVGLVERGYLFLVADSGLEILQRNYAVQRERGVEVALLQPQALATRFPWIATDGIAMGSLGVAGEGWFDGYLLLQAFRKLALSQHVHYLTAEVVGIDLKHDRIASLSFADGSRLEVDVLVNAAGPWAANVARMAGIELPVRARRRCVYYFLTREPLGDSPLVIDRTGIWFRPEGDGVICGFSPAADKDFDNLPLHPDSESFETIVWPALAERVPAFDSIRVAKSWAGYYEFNIFDHNGIVGPHPQIENLYFANGFSGHGLQHSPAVGRGIAERIIHGRYRTIDLTPLSFDRLIRNEPLVELNVI